MNKLQEKLLNIMLIFDKVCKENEITYYILGGTMLGAIRHKGFIPWDDDMDVGLPRSDYEKLIGLSENNWPKNIFLKTPKNTIDFIFPFSKLMDRNTTLIESRGTDIIGGIYIDIFPLDGAGDCFNDSKTYYNKFNYKRRLLYNNQDNREIKGIIRKLFRLYSKTKIPRKIITSIQEKLLSVPYESSSFIGNYNGSWGFKEIMQKSILGKPKEYEFEGYKFYGVENYDKYLKLLYGNYLEFPPKEKRISPHDFQHLDLNMPYQKYKK